MSIQNLLNFFAGENGLTHGIIAFFAALTIIQVAPIKIDPWKFLFETIGRWINSALIERVDSIEEKLDRHIVEYKQDKLEDMRSKILDFANACMNKRPQTQESYIYMLKICDEYEDYIAETGSRNGEVSLAMDEIRRLYKQNMQDNSFLREGE